MAAPNVDFTHFYAHRELRRALKRLADWKPDFAVLHVIGKSPGGRDVFLMEVTNTRTGRGEDKPGYLVHGNIHAGEVSGATAALYLVWRLLSEYGEDEPVTRLLDRIVFYVIPRISVDGAEETLVQGHGVRSRATARKRKNALYPADVNGDGLILTMRWPDPHGSRVAFDDDPRLLLERLPGDEKGTTYRVETEGLIHEWDGGEFAAGDITSYDFNRNWGANWFPPHVQHGAGRYGFSEPEMRAVADFAFGHPNLFGALGFHTGPNCVLRPPATKSDSEIDGADIVVLRSLAKNGSDITGFPNRSVSDYHGAYSHPNKLRGHFTEWGYEHLGLFVFEIELGILANSIGYSSDEMFAFLPDQRREMQRRLMHWHDTHPEEEAFVDWRPFDHPQLGRVEIGGWRPTAVANVAPEDRVDTWHKATSFILEHAGRAPRLTISGVKAEPLGSRLYRLECRVANEGAFPTHITRIGAGIGHLKGVIVELDLGRGMEMVANSTYTDIGHLGAFSGMRRLHWVVRAPAGGGTVTIRCHAARAGQATNKVKIPR